MKIRELIKCHDIVEDTMNHLIKKLPKINEFHDPLKANVIEISIEDAKSIIDSLELLERLLNGTIESISVKELWNIDECFKGK